MRAFTGFPAGRSPFIPIPEVFFTQLLPEIEDSFELKVTLFIFWRLAQKKGTLRCISDKELLRDQELLNSLKRLGDPRPPEEHLRQALEQAVIRGTLLRTQLLLFTERTGEAEAITWFFFHTARTRKVVQELEGGQLIPASFFKSILPLDEDEDDDEDDDDEELEEERLEPANRIAIGPKGYFNSKGLEKFYDAKVQVERPNIFVLYEQNIGLLSPLLADQLIEAEKNFPFEWIEDAFREAVQRNKRNWSYIRAILRRWETEGRQ